MNALLIPIYEPTERVLPFLKGFSKGDFDAFLVVDDGSGEAYRDIFDAVAKETVFSVVSYDVNHGKGHALKHGLRELLRRYPDLDFVVTADGDGQHIKPDILAIRDAALSTPGKVVLGARDFKDAPKKSASGNLWSARYFRLATGVKIQDCQTGLRALPKESFDLALYTYGERFDYEMNFLITASREFGLHEVTIHTIYEDGNKGTHFRPVVDSLLIMRTPIAYLIVGLLSFIIDMGAFIFMTLAFPAASHDPGVLFWCHFAARSFSLPFNYIMLEKVVFHHRFGFHASIWKFAILAYGSMMTGFWLSYACTFFTSMLYLCKGIIDMVLGIAKYYLNLLLIFANRKFGRKTRALH